MSDIDIPAGFSAFPLDGSFNDVFAPLYMALDDNGPRIGLRVQKHHLNPMGMVHGAVYMGLLDIAFASSVGYSIGKFTGTPTISIDLNYMAPSKEGEWLYTDTQCLKTTTTMGFVMGSVRGDDGIKVSAKGVFKLPADLAAAEGFTVEEVMALSR